MGKIYRREVKEEKKEKKKEQKKGEESGKMASVRPLLFFAPKRLFSTANFVRCTWPIIKISSDLLTKLNTLLLFLKYMA